MRNTHPPLGDRQSRPSGMEKLSALLFLLFFLLWCGGLVLAWITDFRLLGLPLWFWTSCIFAYLIIAALVALVLKGRRS